MKKLLTTIFILLVFLIPFQAEMSKPTLKDAGKYATNVADGGGYVTGNDAITANKFIGNLISVVLSIVGVLFLILMLYGGFLWMTAAGDESKVTKAKNLITAAVIGVIITTSAYAISYFIISKVQQNSIKPTSTEQPAT